MALLSLSAAVTGQASIAAAIQAKIAAARAALKTSVASATDLFVEEAKAVVHVESGELRDGIHAQSTTDTDQVQTMVATSVEPAGNQNGFDPPYARRLEYGFVGVDSLGRHYHQPAYPYMRPAWDTQQDAAMEAIANALSEALGGA
jgi:hypothetical protein